VGSRNSNKYHYRTCKRAKYIRPKSERVFHSVAEAQKAGYISCPTCRPPLTDESQMSAR
jgi:methylphosphotriester-DNA--protein-cysteine methyltransferase